jgi:hypothetical protein
MPGRLRKHYEHSQPLDQCIDVGLSTSKWRPKAFVSTVFIYGNTTLDDNTAESLDLRSDARFHVVELMDTLAFAGVVVPAGSQDERLPV